MNRTLLLTSLTEFRVFIIYCNINEAPASHIIAVSRTRSLYCMLTCICLRRRLFRVTLEISRTVINLAYRDIVTSQWGHWPLLIRTRYVCTCVGVGSGMGGGIRKNKAIRWGAYYYSFVLNAQPCKYDMYKSSLRQYMIRYFHH
jgi:hypothetical protein